MQFTPKSDMIILRKHLSRFPWEKEIGKMTFEHIESMLRQKPTGKKEIIDNEPFSKK